MRLERAGPPIFPLRFAESFGANARTESRAALNVYVFCRLKLQYAFKEVPKLTERHMIGFAVHFEDILVVS